MNCVSDKRMACPIPYLLNPHLAVASVGLRDRSGLLVSTHTTISPPKRMQAILAGMAAYIVSQAPPSHLLVSSSFPTSNHPLLSSSFTGLPIRLSRQPLKTVSISATRPLTVVAETKKAVAVLKGNSSVEGVVTLVQEDSGLFFLSHTHRYIFSYENITGFTTTYDG